MDTIGRHIFDALEQVRELKHHILAKQRFKGYSGRARALTGTLALAAAVWAGSPAFPRKAWPMLVLWISVAFLGLILNYGALIYWYFHSGERNYRRLSPALEAWPSLLAGAVLTLAFLRARLLWPLFGMWMCLFGLTNLSSRHVLPSRILHVGLFYVACGAIFLLAPNPSFLNPWPMGIVFFAGEWAAALVLHYDEAEV